MNKEFIPYNEALALKELGFDEPCFTFYPNEGKIGFNGKYHSIKEGYKNSTVNDIWIKKYGKDFECVTAPTFSQAVRWLLILVNKNKHFSNKWTISYNEDYCSLFLGGCNMEVFKAELECLKKLIETVKEKK